MRQLGPGMSDKVVEVVKEAIPYARQGRGHGELCCGS